MKISFPDYEACKKAQSYIKEDHGRYRCGEIYVVVVKHILLNFGAIVELDSGKDGLHISELENR